MTNPELDQAYYDWASNAAYAGGGNNYRLKATGRIAPWNKAVKQKYGADTSKFHNDATEWAKSHSTISMQRLEYEQRHERSSFSQKMDEERSNKVTIEPSDQRVNTWLKHPGRSDIRGIDTPRVRIPRIAHPKFRRLR